jgi:hypothetical protein
MALGDGHQLEIAEGLKVFQARLVIGQVVPKRGADIIGGGGAGPEEPDRFFDGFATRLQSLNRGARSKIHRAGRRGRRGDHVTNPLIAVHDDLVIRMAAGMLLEFLKVGNVAKVHARPLVLKG